MVDTTGAGDAYAAGFLAALTAGREFAECGRWGVGRGGRGDLAFRGAAAGGSQGAGGRRPEGCGRGVGLRRGAGRYDRRGLAPPGHPTKGPGPLETDPWRPAGAGAPVNAVARRVRKGCDWIMASDVIGGRKTQRSW